MREYCAHLGREGVAKRIIEIAQDIVKQEGAYQSTLRNAGKIRMLTTGCSFDSYWDEKQGIGRQDMLAEAEQYNRAHKQKCEWVPCGADAKWLESNGKGGLVHVCTPHRRLLTKQKKADNNV